ncbi:SixA phosphatase family protein [Flavobacterium tegetincola]|uniref:SixA phosphatase family protein n=1 Tax=Flavobacterium tegetincola TaxID=150172 RepID=UPI0003F50677|nr:histidine phosphatase family protein [Flavobacterium tegetincola]
MKNVILIRHAKSSWDSPSTDKKRPLANRGVADAHLVSSHIASFLPKKSIIWGSTAKRAKDTATIFLQNITYPLESIIYKEELYTFDVTELVKVIKSCNNSYDCVIIFGHNEAITAFVNKFGNILIDNVSTSGFVSIDFDVDAWEAIEKGHTKKVVFPRDLK